MKIVKFAAYGCVLLFVGIMVAGAFTTGVALSLSAMGLWLVVALVAATFWVLCFVEVLRTPTGVWAETEQSQIV